MQVLVDRASRAQDDAEMDRFDDELLRALASLRTLRDRLARRDGPAATPLVALADDAGVGKGAEEMVAGDGETVVGDDAADHAIPTGRYNGRRVTARLEATR
jgi:hypothetical protein